MVDFFKINIVLSICNFDYPELITSESLKVSAPKRNTELTLSLPDPLFSLEEESEDADKCLEVRTCFGIIVAYERVILFRLVFKSSVLPLEKSV